MNGHYYTEVVFPTAVAESMEVLVKMQKDLNSYKKKHLKGKEGWIEERQNRLTTLFEFIGIAKEAYQVLQKEGVQARKDGFNKGKEVTEKSILHKEQYGNLSFDRKKDRELIRELRIQQVQEQFNI